MTVSRETLQDTLDDHLAVVSMKYLSLPIVYDHTTPSDFSAIIEDLCVSNKPGHFKRLALENADYFKLPSTETVINALRDTELEIAITPEGNADAPVDGTYFAKPHIVRKPLGWLLERLTEENRERQYYFQSQDDNLSDLTAAGCPIPRDLRQSIQPTPRFLGTQQAANLWIGTKGTTSRLHNDNYDNIYIQLSGKKRISLIPPVFVGDLGEAMLQPATYNSEMELIPDGDDAPPVLFPTFDPRSQSLGPNSWLWVIDLEPGDLLFMPALWYHQVEILDPGLNMSLNYWHTPYDDEKRWGDWNLIRQLTQLIRP